MVIQIRPRKKKLTLRRRHHGSSPLRELWGQSLLKLASRLISKIRNEEESEEDDLKDYLRRILRLRLSVIGTSSNLLLPSLPKICRTRIRIHDLVDAHIPGLFRFNDKSQLLRLCAAFQFPPIFIAQNSLQFSCDEVCYVVCIDYIFPIHLLTKDGSTSLVFVINTHRNVSKYL